MSLEWLSTLSCWGIRPFKKRPSPLVTSGQQIFFVSSVAGISMAEVNMLVTFQMTNFLCMSLLALPKLNMSTLSAYNMPEVIRIQYFQNM